MQWLVRADRFCISLILREVGGKQFSVMDSGSLCKEAVLVSGGVGLLWYP